jgi:uncharacterized protein
MAYALIAGGSKGIGFAIAEAAARRGYSLILVGRDPQKLSEAKGQLQSAYPIVVETICIDLSGEDSATTVASWCTDHGIELKILCNVAGIGGAKDYLSLPLEKLRYMTKLNVESDMALCLTLLPLLERNSPSFILNVSSLAGFAPIPIKNIYSATKSATIFFSYSLRYQLKTKNISVSCLCPGPVFTKPEIEKDTRDKLGWFGVQMAVQPQALGETAVRLLLKKRMIIVPGTLAKVVSIVLRALPRRFTAFIYYTLGKN